MPWSDHSDDDDAKAAGPKAGGAKPAGPKAGEAKPGGAKPTPKPNGKPGPWGASTPTGPVAGPERGAEPARPAERETPRKPAAGGPRKPPTPPTSDDLTLMLRRVRQRALAELAALQTSHALPRIAAALVGAALAIWIASGYFQVRTGEVGVVTTFGALTRIAPEGPGYHLPAPIERVDLVSTTALQAITIGAGGADDPRSLMPTSDGNIVAVNFTVQYRIADPRRYLFEVKDAPEAIRAAAETAIRDAVGRATYAQVLGGDHTAIQDRTRSLMQAVLNRYGAGVTIADLQIVGAGPPKEVTPDSLAVAAARQAVQTALNDAATAAARAANDARGAANKMRIDAETYSARVTGDAQAETGRFSQIDEEYRRAPAITKNRLYTETMERILTHANKVIVDARGAATPIVLPPDAFHPHGPSVVATTPGAGQ